MNRRHDSEKAYLGLIQHTEVVSKTGIIYKQEQSILQRKGNVHYNLSCCLLLLVAMSQSTLRND